MHGGKARLFCHLFSINKQLSSVGRLVPASPTWSGKGGFYRVKGSGGLGREAKGRGHCVYKQECQGGVGVRSVPQLWLKVCHYQDGEEGEKTGYFLLSSSGSGRRKGRVEAGGGRGRVPPRLQASTPCKLTWRVAQQPPYPPVSPDPTPNHCSPSGRQRSAQPAQRSAAQQTLCPEARAVRAQSKGSGYPAWKRGSGSVRAQ